ncbi:dermonecrotic toxin domain-containing protein [Pseudomonas sp. H11T01]|uniref:dermonecrotic toxin domain-containing protein n=1 Tax=Pseudomonas sp. H11T01 TaxID=3402749 RepID=UPI003ACB4191
MIKTQEHGTSDQHLLPVTPMREDLKAVVETALPLSPGQFGGRLIQAKWGQDIAPQTAQLVTLDYNYHGHPEQSGIQQGRVASSHSLTRVLLSNYQTVGDGRFGETAFGLYTPPDIGPEVRIVDKVDEFAYVGSGNHETYEGIYRRTDPQTYGPLTQITLRPADFKKWVWELEFKDQYRDYIHQAWPSDEVIVAPGAYSLRTSVKAAFVMTAYLQRQENTFTQDGLELAMQAVGLAPGQKWAQLTIEQLRAPTRVPHSVEVGRLVLYRYTATDIWSYRHRSSSRILLYIPGNSSPLHYFANAKAVRDWIVEQGKDADKKQALAAHFAEDDRNDGTFHGGVLTALDGMALYPRQHHLKKGAGFFNDDGYWDPADYIHFEVAPSGTDPFAQLVLTMKQAAQASIETIRDDAQVNRDDLSAVVEPIVQWVNTFGPLALFVPGGEGLLALAGIIDAGYGLDQAINGKNPNDPSAGVTRTVFGVLNALPLLGAGAALKGEGAAEVVAKDVAGPAEYSGGHSVRSEVDGEPLLKDDLPNAGTPLTQPPSGSQTRVELMREIGASVASFSDEVLEQIGKVSAVDNDMLRLMQAGRPPTPLLADTISRFKIDQDLQGFTQQAELFQARYDALQHSESEWVRLFQREYSGLPKSAIEQILDRSGVDVQASPTLAEAKRLLRQLDGKASQYEQHARLNRAYEGFYLQAIEHPETDILALHSLKALPGWSKAVRVEVLEGSAGGRVLDHIGPINAPVRRHLIKVGNRYQGYDVQGVVRQDTDDFYQAILATLPETERSALQLQPLDEAGDLKLKISEWALPRSELIVGLNRMDSGLSFDMQGLRGGGYPTTLQGEAFSHEVVILQVKSIYPEFTTAQADDFLQGLGAGARKALERLHMQFEQLVLDMRGWIEQVEQDIDDMDVPLLIAGEEAEGMDAAQIEKENIERLEETMRYERQARIELASELTTFWQKRGHESSRLYAGEQMLGYKLDLDFEDFHSLPALGAKFTEVVELSMKNFQLTRPEGLDAFLECFPNLRALNMEGVDLRQLNAQGVREGALPQAIPYMLNLTTLNLKSTWLVLTERAAGQLSDLVHLQVLDLSDNPLGDPPLILGMTELRKLNLSDTGITRCPLGIPDQPHLESLDLRNNQITRIPAAVLTQAVARDHVQLWGNPLTDEDSLRRIIAHREQTGINLWLSAPRLDLAQPAVWLQRLPEAHVALKRLMWQRLEARPRGVRFLRTFEGLSRTADFQVSYPVLQARIWRLLDEAHASEELWGLLNRDVALSVLDVENPFVSFARLENRVRLYRDWVQMGRPIPIADLQ